MQLIYWERLIHNEDDPSYMLSKDPKFSLTEELNEALGEFTYTLKGLHVCFICTDELQNPQDMSNIIEAAYSLLEYRGYTKMTEYPFENYANNKYVLVEKSDSIGNCLESISSFQNNQVNEIVTICKNTEKYALEGFWQSIDLVKSLSDTIAQEDNADRMHVDIKCIFLLPAKFFHLFISNNCFFPPCFETVIKTIPLNELIIKFRRLKDRCVLFQENLTIIKPEYIDQIKEDYNKFQSSSYIIEQTNKNSTLPKYIEGNIELEPGEHTSDNTERSHGKERESI